MYSVWHKYIYNKIKMKNLPVLLTLYWLSMQIYGIVTLFDGLVQIYNREMYDICPNKLEHRKLTVFLEIYLFNFNFIQRDLAKKYLLSAYL